MTTVSGEVEKDCTVADLKAEFKKRSITLPSRKTLKKELVDMAKIHKIHTKYKGITSKLATWVRKPKGLLEVCYERRFLNPDTSNFND